MNKKKDRCKRCHGSCFQRQGIGRSMVPCDSCKGTGVGSPVKMSRILKHEFEYGTDTRIFCSLRGMRCYLCGCRMTFLKIAAWQWVNRHSEIVYQMNEIQPPNYATVDHVIPTAKGGRNVPSNWQPCCLTCNSKKSDLVLEVDKDE